MSIYLDDFIPVVKYEGLNVENATVTLPSTTTIGGSSVSALGVVTSASADAIAVGRQGATDPVFNVDSSTALQTDGVKITGGAAGDGVAVLGITSGTNAPMTIDAAGSGTIEVGTTSTGLVLLGENVTLGGITDVDAQNATPTIAQILGGIIKHTSVTGAGTVTVPTGTAMSAGVSGVAVGTVVKWLYHNDGNQTATITAAADHTLVGGTAAVTTGKHMNIVSTCTAANTWVTYLETLM